MKPCVKCGAEKPLTEFYKNKRERGGFSSRCRVCYRGDVNSNRLEKASYYREYDRKRWADNDERRQQHTAVNKAWRLRNPEKRAAHIILRSRVVDGSIIRPDTCQDCGSTGKIHGHHHDYAKPLDVEWLCPLCHAKRHA